MSVLKGMQLSACVLIYTEGGAKVKWQAGYTAVCHFCASNVFSDKWVHEQLIQPTAHCSYAVSWLATYQRQTDCVANEVAYSVLLQLPHNLSEAIRCRVSSVS